MGSPVTTRSRAGHGMPLDREYATINKKENFLEVGSAVF